MITADTIEVLTSYSPQYLTKAALIKFQTVYDPKTVGIAETCEQIDEVLWDIEQEMEDME